MYLIFSRIKWEFQSKNQKFVFKSEDLTTLLFGIQSDSKWSFINFETSWIIIRKWSFVDLK